MFDRELLEKSSIPISRRGDWKIEKFKISEKDAEEDLVHCILTQQFNRQVSPGSYTKLTYKGVVIMSDTPAELNDHVYFANKAQGNVLINGLGLGIILEGVLRSPKVESVVVNEISEDVIKLVAPYIKRKNKKKYKKKLTINNESAFTYHPNGMKFNSVWHDIWTELNDDNIDQMKYLHRRYGHWLLNPHYQGSWGRDFLESKR